MTRGEAYMLHCKIRKMHDEMWMAENCDSYCAMFDEIDELVKDLTDWTDSTDSTGWVPVSEGLPDTEDHVLCCTETKQGRKNVVIGYYMDGWRCGMNSNVIAWMHLPNPYEGGMQDDRE